MHQENFSSIVRILKNSERLFNERSLYVFEPKIAPY